METINAIEVKGLWAAYEDRMIIEEMNLKIPKGKITIIIGANGCGKSTLLKVISRILPAKRGEVRIDGMDLCKEKAEYIAKKLLSSRRLRPVRMQLPCVSWFPTDVFLTAKRLEA